LPPAFFRVGFLYSEIGRFVAAIDDVTGDDCCDLYAAISQLSKGVLDGEGVGR
jgi:hypothetical protein